MRTSITIFFLSIFLATSLEAQQLEKQIDSILQVIEQTSIDSVKARNYLELSDLTMYNDQKKTLEYIDKANTLFKKSQNAKGVAKLFAQKANYFYRLGKIDSARYYQVRSVDKSLPFQTPFRPQGNFAAAYLHNFRAKDLLNDAPLYRNSKCPQ